MFVPHFLQISWRVMGFSLKRITVTMIRHSGLNLFWGNAEGPCIAFIAEYDALPVVFRWKMNVKRGSGKIIKPGHTCGHNWIAAAAVGASLGLSKLKGLDGRVVLIGTPAEETVGSKVDMVKAGAFDDVDIVIEPHLESFTDINCTALALDALEFRFYGKATHAASYPYKGINALDSVQLMFAGVNALRQQLREDVKICGIITSGERPRILFNQRHAGIR